MMMHVKAKNVVQVDEVKIKQVAGRRLGNEETQLAGESDQVKGNFDTVARGSRTRSRNNSHTATVVTVNRRSTEALISLETSVDGEAANTFVSVRTNWPGEARDPLHFDAAWMTTCDIARAAIFVNQLFETGTSPSRTDDTLSRRWPGDSGVAAPGFASLPTIDSSPRSALRGEK